MASIKMYVTLICVLLFPGYLLADDEPDRDWLSDFWDMPYTLTGCANLDAVLQEIGTYKVGFATKEVHPTVTWSRLAADKFREVETLMHVTIADNTYVLDKEEVIQKLDGREVVALLKQDKNILTEIGTWTDDQGVTKTMETVREFTEEGIKVTMAVNDKVAICTYE